MNTTPQFINQQDWDTVSDLDKENNAKRHNRATHGIHSCLFCNRTISDKAYDNAWFVHMTINHVLVANGVEDLGNDSSQGYFPVGSDCIKKVPTNFRTKFNQ